MKLEIACKYALRTLVDAYRDNMKMGHDIDQLGWIAIAILDLAYIEREIEYDFDDDQAFFETHGDYKPPALAAEIDLVEALILDPDRWEVDSFAVEVLAQIAKDYPVILDAIKNAYAWRSSSAGISELLTLDDAISVREIYERICRN
jgi:hypothetical protein